VLGKHGMWWRSSGAIYCHLTWLRCLFILLQQVSFCSTDMARACRRRGPQTTLSM